MTIATHVGLNVHKNSIFIAIRTRDEAKARALGEVPNDLTRLLRKLKKLEPPESVQI